MMLAHREGTAGNGVAPHAATVRTCKFSSMKRAADRLW